MVKALHRAGIEVILDVVYNHTAEGNHLGPMLSFKGIDNASYYRLMPDDPSRYMDFTGTGNSLNPRASERAAADHGLAALLGHRVPRRRLPLRPRLGARARALRRRPPLGVLRRHPPGPGALAGQADRRAVGSRARAATRSATSRCSGRSGTASTATRCATSGAGETSVAAFASRFTGSSDLYESDGRHPSASINFVTAHDGFTLADLVSYNEKHNEANGEDNRDGTDDNRSWNCGVEGPTDDPEINALRERQQRNFLATLLLSQGVPMIVAGDEMGRTQHGNNNAWCQDNEISWLDWELDDAARGAARVHAPPAGAAPRAPDLPPHAVPQRRGLALGPPRRLVVPARRPAHDGRRLAERRTRTRSASSSTAAASGASTPQGEPIVDSLVPPAAQRPPRGHRRSRCRRGASARAGRSSSRPPIRDAPATLLTARGSAHVTARSLLLLRQPAAGRERAARAVRRG